MRRERLHVRTTAGARAGTRASGREQARYHQRPVTPLQVPWRASRIRPGAQREVETEAAPSVDGPSPTAAQPRVSRSADSASSAGRRIALESEREVFSGTFDCIVAGLAGSLFVPRIGARALRAITQEECHRSPLSTAALPAIGAWPGANGSALARPEGRSFPQKAISFLSLGAALAAAVIAGLGAPRTAAAHPLPIHRPHHPPHSLAPDALPPRVSGESGDVVRQWLAGERLTGEWGGARSALRDRGVELEATWIGDLSRALRGGVREQTDFRQLFDVNGTLDLERLVGLPGATIFFDAYGIQGDYGSADIGDFQVYSNIDNPKDRFQLAELWWQQMLLGELIRLKLGKFDANSEFAFVDAAGDFINSSAGFSPTIFAMVTYPEPATGVLAFLDPAGPFYAGVGFFDGAGAGGAFVGKRGPKTFFRSDGDHFVIGEIGGLWDESARFGPGRVAVGPWYHDGSFERFDGSSAGGTGGFFALFEQRVFAIGPQREEGTRDVRLFGQYGWADPDISAANHHVSLGLLVTGPFAPRASDTAGAMVSWVDLADVDAAGFTGNETAVELFYRVQLTPFFSLKPDLQIIDDPGGTKEDTAVVGTLRFEIGL